VIGFAVLFWVVAIWRWRSEIPTLDPDLGKELSTRRSQRIETNDDHAIAVTPDVTLSAYTDHGKVG
jgi:hypothetical protein